VNEPILIASPTRSGTTMVAWLLHIHGAWIGEAKVTKAKGSNPAVGTENVEIKTYLRSVSGVPDDFRKRILSLVDNDGPWLVKTAQNLLKMDAWLTHFPEARWVLTNRDTEAIIESTMRHPGMTGDREKRRKVVELHKHLQQQVAHRAKHVHWVDVDDLANAKETTGRRLVEFCGLEFDPEIFNNWIQPERWHG